MRGMLAGVPNAGLLATTRVRLSTPMHAYQLVVIRKMTRESFVSLDLKHVQWLVIGSIVDIFNINQYVGIADQTSRRWISIHVRVCVWTIGALQSWY